MKTARRPVTHRHRLPVTALLVMALSLVACADLPRPAASSADHTTVSMAESTYGIRIEGLRLSAAGSMLDLRYRVLDPEKASPMLNGKIQPFLMDDLRGAKLGVPDTPKLGRLRQTSRNNKILTDRTYFIMFGNPGKAVQSGDQVTLLLGAVKITDLRVQ